MELYRIYNWKGLDNLPIYKKRSLIETLENDNVEFVFKIHIGKMKDGFEFMCKFFSPIKSLDKWAKKNNVLCSFVIDDYETHDVLYTYEYGRQYETEYVQDNSFGLEL